MTGTPRIPLPCPWGCKPKAVPNRLFNSFCFLCPKCGGMGPTAPTESEALRRWNNQSTPWVRCTFCGVTAPLMDGEKAEKNLAAHYAICPARTAERKRREER